MNSLYILARRWVTKFSTSTTFSFLWSYYYLHLWALTPRFDKSYVESKKIEKLLSNIIQLLTPISKKKDWTFNMSHSLIYFILSLLRIFFFFWYFTDHKNKICISRCSWEMAPSCEVLSSRSLGADNLGLSTLTLKCHQVVSLKKKKKKCLQVVKFRRVQVCISL